MHTSAPPFAHTSGPHNAKVVIVGEAVKLSKGLIAYVDTADIDNVLKYKWYADCGQWTNYAKTDQAPHRPRLHTFIMQPQLKLVVNHIDGNGLNCTRANLEICTQSVNARKAALRRTKKGSKFRGVWSRLNAAGDFRYVAEITINYKKTYLGMFASEVEAAKAYNTASLNMLGPNFPLNEV